MVAALLLGGCAAPPEDPERGKPGRAQYVLHCVACHGRDGQGSKHLFPPLAGSEWSQGPAELPIRIVLHGLEGPLTVRGEEYLNLMPPLGKRMSDEDIALALTYVRSAWGNSAPPVAAGEVARVRAAHADREKPWRAEDLAPLLEPGAEAPSAGGSRRAE